MIKYRDYAIITLDDDIYYPSDTILSLYESYIIRTKTYQKFKL
jgi:hypothetical protein